MNRNFVKTNEEEEDVESGDGYHDLKVIVVGLSFD